MGTNSDALSASQAAVFEEHQVRLRVLALRVVAPPARQGTAFEKNRGPNAWAIVQGIALDVKEEAGGFPREGVGGGVGTAADSELVVCSSHLSDSRSRVAHNVAPSASQWISTHYTFPEPSHASRQKVGVEKPRSGVASVAAMPQPARACATQRRSVTTQIVRSDSCTFALRIEFVLSSFFAPESQFHGENRVARTPGFGVRSSHLNLWATRRPQNRGSALPGVPLFS